MGGGIHQAELRANWELALGHRPVLPIFDNPLDHEYNLPSLATQRVLTGMILMV
jgi:hypothetical protein